MKTTKKYRYNLRQAEADGRSLAVMFSVNLADLLDDIDTLKAALEQVEWIGSQEDVHCPWCQFPYKHGHKKDCPRQLALYAIVNKV